MKHTCYFEIAKEANMAEDETGRPSEAYCKMSFDSPLEKFFDEQLVRFASKYSDAPQEYIRIITEDEYLRQTEESA